MTNVTQISRCFIGFRCKYSIWYGLLIIQILFLCTGCKDKEQLDPSLENLGRATGPVEHGMRAPVSSDASGKVHSGSIVETMNVPNYTYIRFKDASGEIRWAAVPKDEVQVGEKVEIVESLVMKDFKSPTLGRTFDSIIFGTLEGAPVDGGQTIEP